MRSAPPRSERLPWATVRHVVEQHEKVEVALRTLLSPSNRAEDDHPHRIEGGNNVIDDLGDPIPNRTAIPQPVDIACLLTHTTKPTRRRLQLPIESGSLTTAWPAPRPSGAPVRRGVQAQVADLPSSLSLVAGGGL
jgi:hypothetical protein